MLLLGSPHTLTPADVWEVAHRRSSAALSPDARAAMIASAAILDAVIAQGRPVYGVNTGFGPLVTSYIAPDDAQQLQRNLIYHLATGVGPALDHATTRAVLLTRASALARGCSGVAPDTADLLLACLSHDLLPHIPALGSVGASGDLTPLAHVALALLGESTLLDGHDAAAAMAAAGVAPLKLAGRAALAIVNGTSVTAAIAALTSVRARHALHIAAHIAAAYAEITRARAEHWDPALGAVRPHPGQIATHAILATLTEGSTRLLAPAATWDEVHPLQDPYSARCVPQLFGPIHEAIEHHAQTTTIELNAASDNPIVDAARGRVIHGGNFFGQHLASASDALTSALVTLALWAERVVARLVDVKKRPDLPPFLQAHRPGLHAGLMGAQVTASALAAALRLDLIPASAQSIPTNADNQDVVPMATLAAWRLDRAAPRLFELLAIAAITAAQAVDLCGGPDGFAPGARALHRAVRLHSAHLGPDRPLAPDISRLAHAWHSGDSLP
jgi:tyrosine ammonia-lyase